MSSMEQVEKVKGVLGIKRLSHRDIDKNMAISVIIPTYNEEEYLPKLLRDLVGQDFDLGFEVIVVDVSKDNTEKEAMKFREVLDLNFLKDSEKGVSKQRNYGAKHAKAKMLLFLDADTRIRKDSLKLLWNFVIKRNFVAGSAWVIPEGKNIIDHLGIFVYNIYALLRRPISPVAPGAFFFIRKEVFDEICGFKEEMNCNEDFDLANRIKKAGYGFAYPLFPLFKFSVRRLNKMGRLRYYTQAIWDGIILLLPTDVSKKLVIGYEPGMNNDYEGEKKEE